MKRYLLGCAVPPVICVITALVLPRSGWWGARNADSAVHLALLLAIVPVLLTWLVTESVHLLRPRRLFYGRPRASTLLLGAGFATGTAILALTALGVTLADRWVADGIVVAAAALLASFAGVLALPRHRRGHCIYCRYDLRGATLTSAGCCTECGALADSG